MSRFVPIYNGNINVISASHFKYWLKSNLSVSSHVESNKQSINHNVNYIFFQNHEKNVKLQAVTASWTTKLGTLLSTYIKLNFRPPLLSFYPPSP